MTGGGTLLALDLAKQTGWAEGGLGSVPRLQTVVLGQTGDHYSLVHSALFRRLWERFSAFPPAHVVIEAPWGRQRGDADEAKLLIGLATTAELVCRLRGVPAVLVKPETVRAYLLRGRQFLYKGHIVHGSGRMKDGAAKHCIAEYCRDQGLSPKNHDESDAAALWFWRAAQLKPALASELTPLFEGRAA